MSSDLSLVQENIEEYVNDENKIVTCKWLSLTLNLHINVAKQALFTFVQHQRNKGGDDDDINVTYFVSGLGENKSGQVTVKCVVVPESHVESVKSSLKTVTSCHVYSVQKAKLKDYTPLYQTDYDIIKDNLESSASHGIIKCPWAEVRSGRSVVSKTDTPEKKPNKMPASNETNTNNKQAVPANSGKAKKAEPKGSIASMFAGGGKKAGATANTGKEDTKKHEAAVEKSKPAAQKKGVAAFFSKQPAPKPAAQPSAASDKDKDKHKAENEKQKLSKDKQKEKVSPKSKKLREEDSDDEGPQRKRRRRIKEDFFDSSEDENEAEAEEASAEEEQMAVSEPEDVVEEKEQEKEKSPKKEARKPEVEKEETRIVTNEAGKRRKRTRKLVPKQYVDEEGFMVTEKVWESDSTDADDEEIEEERKKEEEKKKKSEAAAKQAKASAAAGKKETKGKTNPTKGSVSPSKGKQTSLMSFFKKK